MKETQIHDKRIEWKYLLDASFALEVRAWAREHLGVDAHCGAYDNRDSLSDSCPRFRFIIVDSCGPLLSAAKACG